MTRTFLVYRAEALNNGSPNLFLSRSPHSLIPWEAVRRPFDLHKVNEVADMQAQYIEYAKLPWPQRLEPFRGADGGPLGDVKDARAMQRYAAANAVRQEARNTALVRSARIAIAIERSRAANAAHEIPPIIDPCSGEPMRVARDDVSYVVYSVGPNKRDDGGHATLDLTFRPVPTTLSPQPSTLSPQLSALSSQP